jgi:uncharacterized zinc-type alcohol dehydrogenase-like protein
MPVHAYAAKAAKQALEPFTYEPGPLAAHEVEIRVTHCGICHSDLAFIDNDFHMSSYPLVPGHEVVGVIAAIGANATGLKIGQRVGLGWQCNSCHTCDWCVRGRESLCQVANQPTIVGHYGGWADTVRCHWKFAVPLPDALDSAYAGPLMCAGSTVFTPLVQFGVQSWMRTAVLGIGGLGHLAVQYLAAFGCEVTAISSTHSKDEEARKFGASHFIATKDGAELKKARNSFDFIISTVSASVPWDDYVTALRPQGRLVLVGIPESAIQFSLFPALAEKSISGACAGSPSDNARMLEFTARHGIKPMIEPFPMKEVNRAVEHVRSGKARYRAVLVA